MTAGAYTENPLEILSSGGPFPGPFRGTCAIYRKQLFFV
jgi:hypothetical protein